MGKALIFLSALTLMVGVACTSAPAHLPFAQPKPVEAETVPTGRLPKDVRPTHYEMSFKLDPSLETFEGQAVISLHLDRPRQVLWLHSDGLDVTEARIEGDGGLSVEASWEQVDDWGVAKVSLPRIIPAGDVRLTVRWASQFRGDLAGLYRGIEGADAYIYSHFEPISARAAFPCFDEPSFKTPFDVSVIAPEGLVVIANTSEVAVDPVDEGWTQHRFATTAPLPTYLIAVAVGPFDVVEAAPIPPGEHRPLPIPLRAVGARGKGPQLQWSLDQVAGIMAHTEDYFSMAYPFDKLDIIAVTDFSAGAMENPGAITFRESILLVDETSSADRRLRYATVMAHEIAHMWFGDLVTMPWWDDIWLNESFADWMEVKVVDAWQPGYQALLDKLPAVAGTMYLDSLPGARRIRQPIESNHDIVGAFDPISYEKGGAVLRMFEGYLGPDIFREGVRRHMRSHAFGSADVDDLLESLSQAAGFDVGTPFRTFLTQPGVPVVAARLNCGEGGASLALEQSRYTVLGAESSQAQSVWEVPVCVRFGVGVDEDRRCTLLTDVSDVLDLGMDGCPDWVFPNAEAGGYYRWNLDPSAQAQLVEAGWPRLSSAELISLGDAVESGFVQGRVHVKDVFAVLARLASEEERVVAGLPMDWFERLREQWVDPGQREAVEAVALKVYQPVLARLQAQPEASRDQAFEIDVTRFLAMVGRDKALRANLAAKGGGLLGLPGGPEVEGLPEGIRSLAMAVAVQELGAPAWEAALAALQESSDGALRRSLLMALGATTDEALRLRNMELRYGGALRLNERGTLARAMAEEPENWVPDWEWTVANLDSLKEKLPPAFMAYLPFSAMGFCDVGRAAEVEAVMGPVVGEAPGGPRILSSVLEGVRMCAALRSFHQTEIDHWLASGQ